MSAAFAPSTQSAYETGLRQLADFRATHGLLLEWPVPTNHLIYFVANMSLEGKSYQTAKTYLAGISTTHRLNGWVDSTNNFLLKKLMTGFARQPGHGDQRLPITYDRLTDIMSILPSVCTNTFEVKLFKLAFSLAFFVFLRVSELVGQGAKGRPPLKLSNVTFTEHNLILFIEGSKTDQTNTSTHITFTPVHANNRVCPVQGIHD